MKDMESLHKAELALETLQVISKDILKIDPNEIKYRYLYYLKNFIKIALHIINCRKNLKEQEWNKKVRLPKNRIWKNVCKMKVWDYILRIQILKYHN